MVLGYGSGLVGLAALRLWSCCRDMELGQRIMILKGSKGLRERLNTLIIEHYFSGVLMLIKSMVLEDEGEGAKVVARVH